MLLGVMPMSERETAHQFVRLHVGTGDTIEQWGYSPDEIVEMEMAEDPKYSDGRKCLHVWVLTETEVESNG